MPAVAKILSDEEQKLLQLSEVENIIPEFLSDFGNPEELDKILFRLLNPHAHVALTSYTERKKQQHSRERWLEVITQNQTSLRMVQDKIKQLAQTSKSQNNTTPITAVR